MNPLGSLPSEEPTNPPLVQPADKGQLRARSVSQQLKNIEMALACLRNFPEESVGVEPPELPVSVSTNDVSQSQAPRVFQETIEKGKEPLPESSIQSLFDVKDSTQNEKRAIITQFLPPDTAEKVYAIRNDPDIRVKLEEIKEDLRKWDGTDQTLKGKLEEQVNSLKDLVAKERSVRLRELRRQAPVTKKAIELQAGLHKAIRKGKRWAGEQKRLKALGTSANLVYRLGDPDQVGKTSAYFKVGSGDEEATAAMEVLMWNTAVVMGMEERFVPTGATQVRHEELLTGGGEKSREWTEEGDLQELKTTQPPMKGGIQVAQKGVTVFDYLDDPWCGAADIEKEELIDASLASYALGMFDAHGANILVVNEDGKGKVKYFDNSRSLPNSNGFINRGGHLVSAYRSALLDMDDCYQELTTEEILHIRELVDSYKEKIGALKKYFTTSQAKGLLRQLPYGWMNVDEAMQAMEDRVTLLRMALDPQSGAKTLEQVLTFGNPAYKFAFILEYLDVVVEDDSYLELTPEEVCRLGLHSNVGGRPTDVLLDKLVRKGYDVEWMKDLCDDGQPLMKIIAKVQQEVGEFKNNPQISEEEKQERISAAKEIRREMVEEAAIDYKDWSRGSCNRYRANHHFAFLLHYLMEVQEGRQSLQARPEDIVSDSNLTVPTKELALRITTSSDFSDEELSVSGLGYDVDRLKELCQDPDISLEEAVSQVQQVEPIPDDFFENFEF